MYVERILNVSIFPPKVVSFFYSIPWREIKDQSLTMEKILHVSGIYKIINIEYKMEDSVFFSFPSPKISINMFVR